MSAPASLMRLFALKRVQEDSVAAELRLVRHQRERYLSAAENSRLETRQAAEALFAALQAGEREYALAAGVGHAFGPMRQRAIAQELLETDALVEEASARWQAARIERMQVESVLTAEQRRERAEREAKEQKSADGWFLARKLVSAPRPASLVESTVDESSQRFTGGDAAAIGNTRAESKF